MPISFDFDEYHGEMLPVRMFGLQAALGVFWWILLWFLYIGTNNSDELSQAPILWMWKNLTHSTKGWLCAAYFTNFFLYGFVSGVEFLGYMWMVGGDGTLLAEYAYPWGFWITLCLYWVPPFLFMMQLVNPPSNGGIEVELDADTYVMDYFGLFFGFLLWIVMVLFKAFFTADTVDYARHVVKQCVCQEAHMPKNASAEQRMLSEDYARDMCEEKCGMPEMVCGLDRAGFESYNDYKSACRAARSGGWKKTAEPEPTTPVETPAADGW